MLASDVIERAERRVGQTLKDKWHLDRVIGVGGMAAVYEATHRNKNRVAIKILHPEMSLDEGTRSRFLREGYVANTIRHIGSVQVLDDDVTEDGAAFLVMELLQGESLEERMLRKGGRLEASESLILIEGLLEILIVAHEQGVIHRDIKPDNLFLTQSGQMKVLDFGIARLQETGAQVTRVGSFMGTPAFCAPEQARGRWNEVDARTDLFSVGATLFTMLTGRHVHEAETSSEQLALAISSTPRSLRDVIPDAPSELVELVDLSLAYDKEDRFQTARAFRAAVQRTLAGLPVHKVLSAPPADPPAGVAVSLRLPSATLSSTTRRILFSLVALAIAGAIMAVSGIFSGSPDDTKAATERGTIAAKPAADVPAIKPAPSENASVAVEPAVEVPSRPPEKVPSGSVTSKEKTPQKNNSSSMVAPAVAPSSPPIKDPKPSSPSEDDLFGKRY